MVSIKVDEELETVNVNSKCICAVSNKAITTQRVVVILKTGVVMLKDVYDSFVYQDKKTSTPKTARIVQASETHLSCHWEEI